MGVRLDLPLLGETNVIVFRECEVPVTVYQYHQALVSTGMCYMHAALIHAIYVSKRGMFQRYKRGLLLYGITEECNRI